MATKKATTATASKKPTGLEAAPYDTTGLLDNITDPKLRVEAVEAAKALREVIQRHARAASELRDLSVEAGMVVRERISNYDKRVAHAEEIREACETEIKATLGRYAPKGGAFVVLGEWRYGLKKAEDKMTVNPDAIVGEWREMLESLDVDGRPLVVPTLDLTLLEETFRRKVLDKKELVEAGILNIKPATPAWDPPRAVKPKK